MTAVTAFLYTDSYLKYQFGPSHPFQPIREKNSLDLLHELHVFNGKAQHLEPPPALLKQNFSNVCDAIYIKMAESSTAEIIASAQPSVSSKYLYPGWNLVGLASYVDMNVADALVSIYTVTGEKTGYSQVISLLLCQEDWVHIRDGEDGQMMQVGNRFLRFFLYKREHVRRALYALVWI